MKLYLGANFPKEFLLNARKPIKNRVLHRLSNFPQLADSEDTLRAL